MKNIYKSILLSTLLIMFFSLACNDEFLEIDPYGSVSETTLSNIDGLNKLLIGAYALVDGGGASGGGFRSGINYLRGGADDSTLGTETGPSSYDSYMADPSDSYIHGAWRFWYAAVGRANDVLQLLPTVEDASAEELLQIEAEARFLRGTFYTYLKLLFGNVPLIDETVTYGEGNYFVPNNAEVFPFIEADFKFAIDNLTATKRQVGRANSWAAKAFLAKIYMHQNKFSAAKTLLEDVITNGVTSNGLKYDLLDEYNHNFINRTRNGSESVFAMQMTVVDGGGSGTGNPWAHYDGTYGGPATCCYGWNQPTFDFVDAFQTDPESGLPLLDSYRSTPLPDDNGIGSDEAFTPYQGTLDPRLDWNVGRRGIPYRDWGVHPGNAWVRNQFVGGPYNVIKNIPEQATASSDQASGGGYSNNPLSIIRFADVLLWAAECEIEIGSLQAAEDYVNLVRGRAANPDGFVKKYIDPANPLAGFSDEPAANYKVGLYDGHFESNGQTYARKAVRFERRLELGLEHHRFFDMVRWDGNDFNMAEHLNAYMANEGKKYSNPLNNYLKGQFVSPKDKYLPIPLEQIDLSVTPDGESVLSQNPGY